MERSRLTPSVLRWLACAALLTIGVPVYAQSLQTQRDALNLIADFADRFCKDVPLRGSGSNAAISVEAKTDLTALLKRIVNLGISTAAEYQKQGYEGLLQKDLVRALENARLCRMQVWNDLKNRLLYDAPPSAPPGTQTRSSIDPNAWELLAARDFTPRADGYREWSLGTWQDPPINEGETRIERGVLWVGGNFAEEYTRSFDVSYPAARDVRLGIDLRFTRTTNEDDVTGLLFDRSDGVQMQYIMMSDGRYALTRRFDNGPHQRVLEYVRSGVNTREWNRLEVEVVNQTITLRLNGSVAAEFRDPDLRGGTVGYFVGAVRTGNVAVEFDNFALYRRH